MSVRVECYVIRGVNLINLESYNHDDNKIEKLEFPWCGQDCEGKFGILYDGMSGNYCIAGYCYDSGDSLGQDGHLNGLVEIPKYSKRLDNKIFDWLISNDLINSEESCKLMDMVVSHYH